MLQGVVSPSHFDTYNRCERQNATYGSISDAIVDGQVADLMTEDFRAHALRQAVRRPTSTPFLRRLLPYPIALAVERGSCDP
jgi:hypothetical protein